MDNFLSELERYYKEVELPKIRQKIREFQEEMGNVGKCMRLNALYERLFELNYELHDHQRRYEESKEHDRPYIERAFIASYIPDIAKKIKKTEMEIMLLTQTDKLKDKAVTPEMIVRAREYPLEALLVIKRNMALCVNHLEKHPSMNCKGNFCYCYACGWTGDAIDVFMKLHHCNFVEAVRGLQ